jgi:hypothetical protein
MNPGVSALHLPLFVPVDDSQTDQTIQIGQLDQQRVSFPVSYGLLSLLHFFSAKSNATRHIHALLNEIVKSPSYFFPDMPLIFDRQGLLAFVPDDNQDHLLNWRALLLEFHIALLEHVGWEAVQSLRRFQSSSASPSDLEPTDAPPRPSASGRAPGSISMRHQAPCVASFSGRRSSFTRPVVASVQCDIAPPIVRRAPPRPTESDDLATETNSIFDFELSCNFDQTTLFKGIVLAVASRGYLDAALGNLIATELRDELAGAGFQLGRVGDPTSVFDDYYATLLRTLLPADVESEILADFARDKIEPVLRRIEDMCPFEGVPHARDFFRSILIPLCYHETHDFAVRAIRLYGCYVNRHAWDLRAVEVVSADARLRFKGTSEHVIVLSAPCGADTAFAIVRSNEFEPTVCGFYDYCYARIAPSGAIDIDTALPSGRYIVVPTGARKEIIHELPAYDDRGPVNFGLLTAQLDELVAAGVSAVHVPGAIERSILFDLTSVTDHCLISRQCGGLEAFRSFCQRAKALGLRVLIDFLPLVSLANSSRKYSAFSVLNVDARGRLITTDIPDTDDMLLNYRSMQLWELLASEVERIADMCDISCDHAGACGGGTG